jgi:hypothetical protein
MAYGPGPNDGSFNPTDTLPSGSADDGALTELQQLLQENLDPAVFYQACELVRHVLGAPMVGQDEMPNILRRPRPRTRVGAMAYDAAIRRVAAQGELRRTEVGAAALDRLVPGAGGRVRRIG